MMKRWIHMMMALLLPMVAVAQCIDFYDLTNTDITFEIGPYNARTGDSDWTVVSRDSVDKGDDAMTSRVTVHRNASAIDARTDNNGTLSEGLQIVPEGEQASIRLGNWLDGKDAAAVYNDCSHETNWSGRSGEAERITYKFTVTDESKYLLLRYAIIWENPTGHNDALPSFQIETLSGESGEYHIAGQCYNTQMTVGDAVLDHVCSWTGSHRICNGSNSTKLTTETHNVAWRDWRTRIINLEDYVGETIRLRITSSDCGGRSHFGYSYFTLRCLNPNIYDPTCGLPTDMRTFVAPTGYMDTIDPTHVKKLLHYAWYKLGATPGTKELMPETTNRLTIPNDGSTYECYIYAENGNCHISLFATAEPRSPLANFQVDKHEGCVDTIYIIDKSAVSKNGVTPLSPHEDVDYLSYDYGDGTNTDVIYFPGDEITPFTYAHDGVYTITQTAHLLNGNCEHSRSSIPIKVRGYETTHEGVENRTICEGDTCRWNGGKYTALGVYPYVMSNAAGGGYCDSIVRLHLTVLDSYLIDTVAFRSDQEPPFLWHGRKLCSVSGTYYDSLTTVNTGCDSIWRMKFIVMPTYSKNDGQVTICSGESYTWHDTTLTTTGVYTKRFKTVQYGMDSVHTLNFTVKPKPETILNVQICEGQTYPFVDTLITTSGEYVRVFPATATRCDSTVRLYMTVQPKYFIPVEATICKGEKYPFHKNGHSVEYTEQRVYYDSLKTVHGCDSVYKLTLTVLPTYLKTEEHTICEGTSYTWHNNVLTEAKDYYDTLHTAAGCDSVVKLTLHVNPKKVIHLYEDICEGGSVVFKGEERTKGGTYYDSSFVVSTGCDSIRILHLNVRPKARRTIVWNLCQGEQFDFKGQAYRTDCTLIDTIAGGAANGCDSITTHQVYFRDVIHEEVNASVCAGQYYEFHGHHYNTEATHTLSGETGYHCDSTYVLHLKLNPTYQKDTTVTLCHGNEVTVFEKLYTTGTTDYRTLKTVGCNCDSVYTIHVNEYAKFLNTESESLCFGDTLFWHNDTITDAGVYYDSLKRVDCGCDSVYKMTVQMRDTFHTILFDTIRNIDDYFLNGVKLTESGIYSHRFTSVNTSCDSVVEVHLTVNPVYHINESRQICASETPYMWNNQSLTTTGTYEATLISQFHTDSIVKLALTVHQPVIRELEVHHMSDQDSLIWHGVTYKSSGKPRYDTISKVTGCDSITYQQIIIHPTYRTEEYDTICSNKWFTWSRNGQSYNESNTYIYNPGTYYWGYDSIFILHLHVNPAYTYVPENAEICEGSAYDFHGRPLRKGDHYIDTILTQDCHCDSIVHLTLTEHPVFEEIERKTICKGMSYQWHNRLLYDQGTYYDTARYVNINSSLSCDSVYYTLVLTVNEPSLVEEIGTTCEQKPYSFRGKMYSQEGIYYDTLPAQLPPFCDSIIYKLDLTVNTRHESTEYDTICEGETRLFGGVSYGVGGYYTQSLTTSKGCDSIVHLNLTVKPITRIEKRVDICEGDSFLFHDKKYATAATYVDTTTSVLVGCDSITTYHVFFHPVTRDILYAETCEGEPFPYYGHEVYAAGEHVFGGQSRYGCDSTHVLYLTVHTKEFRDTTVNLCSGDTVKVLNKLYFRGDVYYDTIRNRRHCDSIIYTITIDEFTHQSSSETFTICKGDSIEWRNRWYKEKGTYHDTIFHPSGCNDVFEMRLQLKQPSYREIEKTIFSTEVPYGLGNKWLRESGVYYDTLDNAVGCDSIIKLTLTVKPVYYVDDQKQICAGNPPYMFNGLALDSTGIYTTTFHPQPNVDSIVTLAFTVYQPIYHETTEYITDKETYSWSRPDGSTQLLDKTGVYDDTLTSEITHCDSIVRLRLNVLPTYEMPTYYTMCDDKRFNWRKYSGLNQTGVYYDSLHTNTWNKDSVYVLYLTVNKTYKHDTTVHICAGDYYEFGGEARYTGGHYNYAVSSSGGCDSTFHLELHRHQAHLIEEYKTICSGDYYDWHGQRYTVGGVYDDSLHTSQWGCDSIYRLHLNIHRSSYNEIVADICEGSYYDFHGRQLNKTGIYWDSCVTAMDQCDSIYRLDLQVHKSMSQTIYDTICGNDYVMFCGRAIYQGGNYTDTLHTRAGCDSVVTLHLMHYPVSTTRDVRAVCRGEEVNWSRDGGRPIVINTAGTYADTLVSRVSGCDSISELWLTVNNTFYQELREHICSNEYYDFHGKLLNQPGTYWDSLTTVRTGCDSIFRLQLTVNPAYEFENTVYMCDWQPYYFAGERITQTGTYYDNLNTRKGCDSIHILHAFVMPSRRDSTAEQLCLGDSYNFNGRTLTNDGIYRDTLDDPITRQCVISVVNLSFVAQSKLSYVQVENACADDGSFIIYNNYVGARPTTYSLLFDERARAVGFADILDQPYTERIEAPIPQRDNATYLRPDYYHATLLVDNSVCVPDSQSAQAVTLLVRYPSWIIEQNWNDVVALLNENYNGGYTFTAYEWIVNDVPTGNHLSYLYLPSTLGTGDEVSIMLTRPGDTYSVPSCPIVIYDKTPELVSEYPVMAHPTDIRGQIRIVAGTDGEYTLYTMTGALISTGTFKNGEQTYIQTHVADGCYLLRLSTSSHGVQTKKIKL